MPFPPRAPRVFLGAVRRSSSEKDKRDYGKAAAILKVRTRADKLRQDEFGLQMAAMSGSGTIWSDLNPGADLR